MNNLSFGPSPPAPTQPGPAVIFTESTAGGAPSNCAAAVTVGDTHLRTFHGLLYDFQAAGDFTLVEVEPNFTVQTRQVSGKPTWPNASVNKAVAARFGKTKVAICVDPPEGENTPRVVVNGRPLAVADGKILELPGGVGIARRGNVYHIAGEDGHSVSATVNPTWIDVNVGLGRWPSTARGLIANANGNVNQIETRDHHVLTAPFTFDDLYHRFADSWRVAPGKSMLSVCGDRGVERGIPKKPFVAADLDAERHRYARDVCTRAGVKEGPLLDACTLDVVVIGKEAAAKVFVDAVMPVSAGKVVVKSQRQKGAP
jgi:hypothetical protein